MMAFGDSDGVVHLWATALDAVINNFSHELDEVSPTPKPLPFTFDDKTFVPFLHCSAPAWFSFFSLYFCYPVAIIFRPYSYIETPDTFTGMGPFSEWPEQTVRRTKPLPPLDSSLIPDLKWQDYVGHAPKPSFPNFTFRRNHKGSFRLFTGSKTVSDNNKKQRYFKVCTCAVSFGGWFVCLIFTSSLACFSIYPLP
jgi:hypothetical protein